MIRNKINGSAYIGQTIRTFNERYDGAGKWWKCTKNKHLKNAALHYGIDNFEVIVLENDVATEDELNRLEIEHIKTRNTLYPNGYNYQIGGQETRNRKHNEYTVKLLCDKNGRGEIKRLLNNEDMKIYEFTNTSRFVRQMGLSQSLVINVLKGKTRAKHKRWSLPSNPIKKYEIEHTSGRKEILFDGELKAFSRKEGIKSAQRFLKLLDGRLDLCKGWTLIRSWVPETDKLEVIKLKQYDLDDSLLI